MTSVNDFFSHNGTEGMMNFFRLFSGLLDQQPLAFYYSRKLPKGSRREWIVEFVSDGITPLLGYKKEDLIGKLSFADLNMDEALYGSIPIHSEAESSQFSLLCTLRTARNTPKKVIDKGLLLFDDQGNLAGAAGVLMDFTLQPGFDILPYLTEQAPREKIPATSLGQLIGHSPAMKSVIDNILKIAPTQAHVLIQGESGTGKELAARAIHEMSVFHNNPFIALNCGAISEHLMESEFFGHVKGAFSGATENRQGYLDVVNKGTLFLDEVGEMPVNMQIKLLRVLDGYGYTPVGSTRVKNSRFRLICATNRKLRPLIAAGVMRLDFYHRIKQLNITMPPLRERAGDMEILINTFAERFYQDNRLTPPQGRPLFPAEAMLRFKAHSWPGNVRELHHAVIKYLSMGEIDFPPLRERAGGEENGGGLPASARAAPDALGNAPAGAAPRSFSEYEREKLLDALNGCGWDLQKAADRLGKSRRTLQRKIARYGLK